MPKIFCLLVLITFSPFVYSDDSTPNNTEQTSKKNPLIAAGLSSGICIPVVGIALPPGMGQIYNGERKKGSLFNLVRYASLALGFISNPMDDTDLPESGSDLLWNGVFVVSVVGFVGSVIYPPIDAYNSANRINANIDQQQKEQKLSKLLGSLNLKHLSYQEGRLSYRWHF